MKRVLLLILNVVLTTAACQPQTVSAPTPSLPAPSLGPPPLTAQVATSTPQAGARVSYQLRASLDNQVLQALKGLAAEACVEQTTEPNRRRRLVLRFAAQDDPQQNVADDETGLELKVEVDDFDNAPQNQPIPAEHQGLRFSASAIRFLPGPQEALTNASGTLTLSRISAREVSGSADLQFSDPNEVNAVVKNSLGFYAEFENLPVKVECAQP